MSEVIYDSILGKIREGDTGGGGGGSGTVTGIESVVNGGTATVTATGGVGAVKFVGVSGTTISSNGNGEIEIAGGGGGAETVISGGYRTTVTSSGGSATVAQDRWFPITNVTGASVTMQPGEAYVIQSTTAAVTINTTTVPANQYGLESHLEIFVANTGYVVTGSNVVLAQALEPDSVNNCTVRFHDGMAIISVEDHVAGYIVTVNAASGAGSLNYGLATASNGYISINASLNGQTLDLGGVVTSAGEKHVVGNGYTDTVISGGISCTSKTTFSNLTIDGVSILGGTATLGDVYIPSGATVAVSGGGLAVEKVTGAGSESVIDLGSSNVVISSGVKAYASGCTFSGGSAAQGGCFNVANGGKLVLSGVTVTGCTATYGGVFRGSGTENVSAYNCVFSGNSGASGGVAYAVGQYYFDGCTFSGNSNTAALSASIVYAAATAQITFNGCTLDGQIYNNGANVKEIYAGSCALPGLVTARGATAQVLISAGATLNMTGNTNVAVISGANGVIVGSNNNGTFVATGSATVINSAGATVTISGSGTILKKDGTLS